MYANNDRFYGNVARNGRSGTPRQNCERDSGQRQGCRVSVSELPEDNENADPNLGKRCRTGVDGDENAALHRGKRCRVGAERTEVGTGLGRGKRVEQKGFCAVIDAEVERLVGRLSFGKARNYRSARVSFSGFLASVLGIDDIAVERINASLIERYARWLEGRGVRRNTVSFYMRVLRAVYNYVCACACESFCIGIYGR